MTATDAINTTYNTVTANTLEEEIRLHVATDVPLMIWGPPGVGKSEIIAQVADTMGYALLDRRVSYMMPEDFFGLPFADRDSKSTIRLVPDIIADVVRLNTETGKPVLLLLDELTSAGTPGVFAACYQLILNRCLANAHLPADTRIIAAGNRASDKGVVYEMPMPLANRMAHVEYGGPTWDEFEVWSVGNEVHPVVMAFLKQQPQYLCNKITTKGNKDGRNPTPRSWAFLSRKMHAADQLKLSHDTRLRTTAATVGDEAALKLETVMRLADKMVPFDVLLSRPDTAPVPDDLASSYLLMTMVAQRIEKQTQFDKVFTYIERMPKELIGVFFRLMLRHPKRYKFVTSRADLIVKYREFASAKLASSAA